MYSYYKLPLCLGMLSTFYMRCFLIVVSALLINGCTQVPTEVKVKLASDNILAVKDFATEPATEYSGCTVKGEVLYDISVEPVNFTGIVNIENGQIEYAGWKGEKVPIGVVFINGKQHGYTVSIYNYASGDDTKEKKEAMCRVKTSSDIKLVDLGKPIMAIQGIRASISNDN